MITPRTVTIAQRTLHQRYERMFGRTPLWRILHAGRSACEALSAVDAYIHLSEVFSALQGWRYVPLSRSAGLPVTPEERIASALSARLEEVHAREVVPEVWATIPDPRPAAFGASDYLGLNPDLAEALEIDYPGLSHREAPSHV